MSPVKSAPAALLPIDATLTRCRDQRALVVLESRPFNGLELRIEELRQMARQLDALADLAGKTPIAGRHWSPTKVVMTTPGKPCPNLIDRVFGLQIGGQ